MKKRILMGLCLMLATALAGFAQSGISEEEKKEWKEKQEAYKASLNLTEAQSAKMEAINRVYFEGLKDLKMSSASKPEKYKIFKSLSNERDAKVKEILTDEQYSIYQKHQKEMKEELKEHRKANR